MTSDRRFYCPFCGTRITRTELGYLKIAIAHGLAPVRCFSATCEGDTGGTG